MDSKSIVAEDYMEKVLLEEIEPDLLKQLTPRNTWMKTKEVVKTAGKVALVLGIVTGIAVALGAASTYAENEMK